MTLTSKALSLSESFSVLTEISWNGSHQFFSTAKLFFHIILLTPCLPSTSGKAASTSLLTLWLFLHSLLPFFSVLQWDTEEPSLYLPPQWDVALQWACSLCKNEIRSPVPGMKNTPKYLSICCTLQKLGTALFFCLGVWLGMCTTCYFSYCVITTAFFFIWACRLFQLLSWSLWSWIPFTHFPPDFLTFKISAVVCLNLFFSLSFSLPH